MTKTQSKKSERIRDEPRQEIGIENSTSDKQELLKIGARDENGRWLDRGESPAPLFDSKTGRAASDKRWQAYQDATAEGVVKKAREIFPEDDIRTPYQAWQKIAEAQYEKALNNPPSAKLIMAALDTVPRGGERSATIQDNRQIHIHMRPFTGLVDNIREFAELFRERGKPEVAAYILEQLDEDNEFPQTVTYPDENVTYE